MECNINEENNGDFGITEWPIVNAGEYSEVNCTVGEGVIS